MSHVGTAYDDEIFVNLQQQYDLVSFSYRAESDLIIDLSCTSLDS